MLFRLPIEVGEILLLLAPLVRREGVPDGDNIVRAAGEAGEIGSGPTEKRIFNEEEEEERRNDC